MGKESAVGTLLPLSRMSVAQRISKGNFVFTDHGGTGKFSR